MPKNDLKPETSEQSIKQEKPKAFVKSTKEEFVMFMILMFGLFAVITVFAINIALLDKFMANIIQENLILREMLQVDINESSGVVLEDNEVVVTVTPSLEPTDVPEPTSVPDDTLESNVEEEVESTPTPTATNVNPF